MKYMHNPKIYNRLMPLTKEIFDLSKNIIYVYETDIFEMVRSYKHIILQDFKRINEDSLYCYSWGLYTADFFGYFFKENNEYYYYTKPRGKGLIGSTEFENKLAEYYTKFKSFKKSFNFIDF